MQLINMKKSNKKKNSCLKSEENHSEKDFYEITSTNSENDFSDDYDNFEHN